MRVVRWVGVVGVGAALLLARAEGAEEKRALPFEGGEVRALLERVAALEARLRALEQVVQVSGRNVRLVSDAGMTIQAGAGMAIRGGSDVHLQGGASVRLEGAAGVDIRGSMVRLNNGNKPIARVGDSVAGAAGAAQIVTGSPTVLSQ